MTRKRDTGWRAHPPPDGRQAWESGAEYRARIGGKPAQDAPGPAPANPVAVEGGISIEGRLRLETDRAVVVRIEGRRSGIFNFTDMTFPRSQCQIEIAKETVRIVMPLWLAKKKGFA